MEDSDKYKELYQKEKELRKETEKIVDRLQAELRRLKLLSSTSN